MTDRRLGVAGVGPQRAATTWLHECLASHPSLCLPDRVKETFFLDERYERGWDWYWSHFEDCPDGATAAEIGPTWFDVPEAADRLQRHNPACRILVSLRDPADRSFSLWRHHRRKGRVGDDFRAAVATMPRILESSHYADHLPRWIERFGRERVHLVLQDDVADRPQRVLAEVYRFLELEPPERPPDSVAERVYAGSAPRFPGLARWAARAARWLRERGMHGVVEWAAGLGVRGVLYSANRDEPRMSTVLRAELVDRFEEDVRFVEELTGRDLEAWRTP